MAIIKLSAAERRRLSVFITCFFLSVIAWVLIALSDTHRYVIREPLNFKNIPQKRAFRSLQSDTVDVTMLGSGWKMLFSRMNSQDHPVDIDLHTLESKNYIVLANQLKHINAQRDADNQIISINPDTLYFDFTNRIIKRVPVKLMLSINYQHQFALSDHIKIKPEYVTLSGPSNRVRGITKWPTDSLKLDHVNEDVSTRVKLKPVDDGSMVIYPKNVQVDIPVDEFTEKTLEIPIKLVNQNYDIVKIFPQKVKITFRVALSNYAGIDGNFFEATANMNLWRKKGYSTLPVTLTRLPSFCKIVSIVPRNIDFIVKK